MKTKGYRTENKLSFLRIGGKMVCGSDTNGEAEDSSLQPGMFRLSVIPTEILDQNEERIGGVLRFNRSARGKMMKKKEECKISSGISDHDLPRKNGKRMKADFVPAAYRTWPARPHVVKRQDQT